MMKRYFKILMAVILMSTSTSMAQADLLGDIKSPQQSAEYIFRSSPKESLISVQLLGAVTRPGVYYVPLNTDLLKLLTLAGGSSSNADMSEILVRKLEPKSWAEIQNKAVNEYQGAYEVDAEKIIKYGGSRQLRLAQDDFVYVPPKTSWISGETSKTVTFVSVLLTIGLTAILIKNNSDR